MLSFKSDEWLRTLYIGISRRDYKVTITPLWSKEDLRRIRNVSKMQGYYIAKITDMLFSNFASKIDKLEIIF